MADSPKEVDSVHDDKNAIEKDTQIEQAQPDFADADFKRQEKALVRKLDCFIAPVMMLLMLISYLDRGNIGFAATQGMTKDLHLKSTELNTAVSVFYIFYILAELPASLLVKRLRFNRVIPTITFLWGLICMCTGFVQSFGGLVATRIFLGFFEGCLFPSMTLFLCNWYTRAELGTRISYLFIASALSGAFGGLIAFGILYMDGTAGYPGWRWLYILEGLLTIAYAGCCIFLVPRDFESAYFLSPAEKQIMRIRARATEAYSGGSGHYTQADMKRAASDIKSWLHGLIQICVVTILYGFGTFLPVILKYGFHFSTKQAQYLVIPPNLWGALVYFVGARLADRYRARAVSMLLIAPFGIAGYAILLAPVPIGVWYFATFLVATACFLCTGSNIAWLSGNCAPDGKRAASVGILLTLTNIGGVVSGQIYTTAGQPRYFLGHGWSLGCVVFAWCGWWVVRAMYRRRNREKEEALLRGGAGLREGDEGWEDRTAAEFRYQL
ncbi:MAG: hypothetical protein Q9160_004215 [Pyrenula sp. 1 TL-2023]